MKDRRLNKKIRKLEKALRRTPPASIDLVQWLMDHKYAQTTGEALSMIYDGQIMAESHVVRNRYIPAELRASLRLKDGVGVSE